MPNEKYPVFEGAEAWSHPGSGERARIGVVIVHGFTGSPYTVRPLGEALAARGFAVVVPRLPGHGTNWRDLKLTRYSDWRGEAVRNVREMAQRHDSVVLVGLSMGGTLVLDVAGDGLERISGVVSINAQVLDRDGIIPKLAPVLEKLIPVAPAKVAGLVKNDIAKGGDERAYAYVPAAAGNSLLAALPAVREALGRVRCPALVAYSAQDHSVPNDNSRAVLRMLGSADKTELVLERSFHVATLDYDAPLLEERISGFIDRVATP